VTQPTTAAKTGSTESPAAAASRNVSTPSRSLSYHAGAFVARRALPDAGQRFSNGVIAEAVKSRKALLSETAQVR
jgi:hypothetical protein